MINDDLRRCAKMLESVVRMSGMSARQLEERLDYGAGTVTRLFSGKIELKLRHVLLILEEVGIPPSQFFREAFPEEDDRPRSDPEMASRLLNLLEKHVQKKPPARPAAEGTISDEELDKRILEALSRHGIVPNTSSVSNKRKR
jgi:transcriptional regulator with XRE-family HTH domain